MHELFARVRRIAPHFRTALLTGQTGTGKELVARALHDLSPVAKGPFVVCNCAALAENLVESELFGYVRGAFTGANQDKTGMFEHAQGGTLVLDEIGEMPLPVQAKLLRAVQQQEVQRLGSLGQEFQRPFYLFGTGKSRERFSQCRLQDAGEGCLPRS